LTSPVDCEPLTPLMPDHAPEAVHEVAFLLDQVNVEESPGRSELGLACKVTVGVSALTVTVTD
jgi:hypothetical protein